MPGFSRSRMREIFPVIWENCVILVFFRVRITYNRVILVFFRVMATCGDSDKFSSALVLCIICTSKGHVQ